MLDLATTITRDTYKSDKSDKSPHNMIGYVLGVRNNEVQMRIRRAHRFTLDANMSEFLASLATVHHTIAPARRPDTLDHFRRSARLPFPQMFMQYDGFAFRKGLLAAIGGNTNPFATKGDDSDPVEAMGYLCEQNPVDPNEINVTLFTGWENNSYALPFQYIYRTDEEAVSGSGYEPDICAAFGHGVIGYTSKSIAMRYSMEIKTQDYVDCVTDNGVLLASVFRLVPEFAGTLRYLWAFLSTLNEVPATIQREAQGRSYLAGGMIRKPLDSNVVRLNLPMRGNYTSLAKRVLALSKKRWHEVRGHWRLYQHGDGILCDSTEHVFGITDDTGHAKCTKCTAWRTWIEPHERGDKSAGVVTPNYLVGARRSNNKKVLA